MPLPHNNKQWRADERYNYGDDGIASCLEIWFSAVAQRISLQVSLFCSFAALDARTMDVLSPFICPLSF